MHQSALDKMAALIGGYLGDLRQAPLAVLEIGSRVAEDTQIGQRQLLSPAWRYTGMDIEAGPGVDITVADPYDWREVPPSSFDVVISSQVFEHVGFPWLTMREVARVLKPRGVALIIAPAAGPEHRFPTDCWRIYPDGWKSLCEYAGMNAVETYTQWTPLYYADGSDKWKDSCLVAQKPEADGEASLIPALADRGVLTAYANARAGKRHSLRYKRKVISGHLAGLLREIFS